MFEIMRRNPEMSPIRDLVSAIANDPFFRMTSTPLDAKFLAGQDCVLIATDHSAYDYDFIVKHSKLVIDTRNATAPVREGREKIRKA